LTLPGKLPIIANNFAKGVIIGAPDRAHYAQEVLKPRCCESLGKVLHRIRLAEAGSECLG
jgi:hypothetical protein